MPRFTFAVFASALALAGCGGSSDSTSSTTVTGSAVAGAVTGTLRVTNSAGTELATATVTGGDFSVEIPDSAVAGELDFEVTGTYTDEVSAGTVNLSAAHPLALRLAAATVTAGTDATVGITPETTVIRQMVTEQTMTLEQARTAYQAALGNAPDGTGRPFDPTATAPAWAADNVAANDAAFRVGAYSQWGFDLGLSGDDLAALPTALAADLADGTLDGQDAASNAVTAGAVNMHTLHLGSPLTARYLTAMATFAGSTTVNVAGLDAPSTGLPANGSVTDTLPAVRTVTLGDGTVVQVQLSVQNSAPFASSPATARTVHRVTITNAATSAPVDVSSISASVMMHMLSGRAHSTPIDGTPAHPSTGVYDFDTYYVMASAMNSGGTMVPMGLWDFKVTLEGVATEAALFHPNVTMPMGGAVLSSKGNDATDQVADPNNPGMTMGRPYWVWLDEVAASGSTIGLYVTTKVGMTFPAVYAGASYSSGMAPNTDTLAITTATVEISVDGTTWTALTGDNAGRYSATAFSGLTAGAADDLWVKVTVDGNAILLASGTNPKLTFMVPN